ncbi:vesicle-trafficking protein SEC22c isoform X1 [Onychomys torridus]|uniref:vesicle-trafficking protein SEC22c isoform X1 n=1 Tax=Onychomys torridus TaxID=38674 RepID=UPI00167F2E63|nr:vesicle-trafficking protein SEC22c isoform X1 [Onychomys torridus]XP_036048496.1 vesicle-trafficking protein SEC22c isoform X1 [Onychomys torridus]XP_036048497.1 vesicle-trafficking protein SEC22c isoform X1 [Onychomys torridus]XP_036048498.1 vesicle-trafficking protein SEC22c isoform X1 [Onychomys torridus]
MPMICFASVVRVRDGLPLSASTDFYHAQEFLECRRQLKALAPRLAQYPGRGSAESRDFHIYFSSSGDVACMAICSHQCPAAMAFCFLETLWWDFTASYGTTCIGLASRPYAFLEFDSVIQKTKWHFNHMSPSQMKSGLEEIQEELEFQPPAVLSLEGTDVTNGMLNGHTPVYSEPAPNLRMEPVTALGVLSLVLNIMCAALNLIRGVHLAEHSLQVAQEEVGNILAFFIPSVACMVQIKAPGLHSRKEVAPIFLDLPLGFCAWIIIITRPALGSRNLVWTGSGFSVCLQSQPGEPLSAHSPTHPEAALSSLCRRGQLWKRLTLHIW